MAGALRAMRALVLVEGQTEEAFVKRVLSPHYDNFGLYFRPTIIETKQVLSGGAFRGGVTSFSQFKRHVVRLLGSARNPDEAIVTSMVDYYRLPNDFPGMGSRPVGSPEARVSHVEREIFNHFGSQANFVPYLSLHEFEALLFASDSVLPGVMNESHRSAEMRAIVHEHGSPEHINERPARSPSHRVVGLFPSYRKLLHGSIATTRISLNDMRGACPHFGGWLANLEALAGI